MLYNIKNILPKTSITNQKQSATTWSLFGGYSNGVVPIPKTSRLVFDTEGSFDFDD